MCYLTSCLEGQTKNAKHVREDTWCRRLHLERFLLNWNKGDQIPKEILVDLIFSLERPKPAKTLEKCRQIGLHIYVYNKQ
jgi:hypothetical protein